MNPVELTFTHGNLSKKVLALGEWKIIDAFDFVKDQLKLHKRIPRGFYLSNGTEINTDVSINFYYSHLKENGNIEIKEKPNLLKIIEEIKKLHYNALELLQLADMLNFESVEKYNEENAQDQKDALFNQVLKERAEEEAKGSK